MTAPGAPAPVAGLAACLALLAASRVVELARGARAGRALRARGAREYGRAHWPWMVALHAAFPLALVAEVAWLGARPPRAWPLWLALALAAQALRVAAMRALGARWTARLWVLPGETLVRRGPYRFVRHPSYLAAALELLALPLVFGAWRTALAFTLLDAGVLAVRIRAEAEAHRDAGCVWP